MDETGSEPVATQHFMRAIQARDRRDFDTAIAELDACLCSDPIPRTAMYAWNELAFAIVMKFDFPNRDGSKISDEEFMWHNRAEKCVRNAMTLYEEIISHTGDAAECRRAYETAKGRADSMMMYGLASRDASGNPRLRSNDVFFRVVIPPLKCLATQESQAREKARLEYESNPTSSEGTSMPESKLPKFIEANRLMRQGKLQEARSFLKQQISDLGEDEVTERMIAAGLLVDVISSITRKIPDKEQRKQYNPELHKYVRIALENYDRAPVAEQQSFRKDNDIEAYRKLIAVVDQASGKKSGCFIATVTYGSPLAPEVLIFRRFRDEILLPSKLGGLLVEGYYILSPPLAAFISRTNILKKATRHFILTPLLRLLMFYDKRRM